MPNFKLTGLTEKQREVLDKAYRMMNADETLAYEGAFENKDRLTVREVLTTDNANILLPETIKMVVREAAEPEYIGSRLLQTVRITNGNSVEFPVMGAVRAFEILEGMEYPEAEVDWRIYGGPTTVKVKKYGLRVRITEEMINDSQWDVNQPTCVPAA